MVIANITTRTRIGLGAALAAAMSVTLLTLQVRELPSIVVPLGSTAPIPQTPAESAWATETLRTVRDEIGCPSSSVEALVHREITPDDPSLDGQASIEVQERTQRRAAALAAKVGLSTDEERALLGVLLAEQDQRTAAFRILRNLADPSESRTRVRDQLDAIMAWKIRSLEALFGPELARALMRR